MTLNVCEIFGSIQGEGPFMGRPALFVRLGGCIPPFCPWCDTPYAQGPCDPMPVKEILSRTRTQSPGLVVITGGEPFVQWEQGLKDLETALLDRQMTVQYETSGKAGIPDGCRGFVVCSPKLILEKWQIDPQAINRADCFKFVVDNGFEHIRAFMAANRIPENKVWLMPLGASRQEQIEGAPRVWQYCVDNNLNFSPRLHTLTFNTKKGI